MCAWFLEQVSGPAFREAWRVWPAERWDDSEPQGNNQLYVAWNKLNEVLRKNKVDNPSADACHKHLLLNCFELQPLREIKIGEGDVTDNEAQPLCNSLARIYKKHVSGICNIN